MAIPLWCMNAKESGHECRPRASLPNGSARSYFAAEAAVTGPLIDLCHPRAKICGPPVATILMGAVRALDHESVLVPAADAIALRLEETSATVFDEAGCLRLLLAGSGPWVMPSLDQVCCSFARVDSITQA